MSFDKRWIEWIRWEWIFFECLHWIFETLFEDNLVPRRENISHGIHTRDQLHILICNFCKCWDTFGIPQTKTGSNKVNDSRLWIFWSLYHFIEGQNLKTLRAFENTEDPEGFYWGGYKAINVNKWHGSGTRCRNFLSSQFSRSVTDGCRQRKINVLNLTFLGLIWKVLTGLRLRFGIKKIAQI